MNPCVSTSEMRLHRPSFPTTSREPLTARHMQSKGRELRCRVPWDRRMRVQNALSLGCPSRLLYKKAVKMICPIMLPVSSCFENINETRIQPAQPTWLHGWNGWIGELSPSASCSQWISSRPWVYNKAFHHLAQLPKAHLSSEVSATCSFCPASLEHHCQVPL